MKGFKKVLAVVLGATMVLGSTVTAFADETPVNGSNSSTAGEGQVLDFKVTRQVVPTALKVAINPNGYDVNLRYHDAKGTTYDEEEKYYSLGEDGKYAVASEVAKNSENKITADVFTADTSDDQIVTFNYGLANKSTVGRKITVKLDVAADSAITFVDSADDATAKIDGGDGTAERGEYKIYMELIPAQAATTPTTNTYEVATAYAADTVFYSRDDDSGVYSKVASITSAETFAAYEGGTLYKSTNEIGTEIQASELGDITMDASEAPIAFAAKDVAGTSYADVAYALPKSTWDLKSDEFIDFSTEQVDLKDMFEMTAIGGVSGFTIAGTMNKNAEWSLLTTKTITITPTYAIEDATGEEVAVTTGLNQVKAEARTPASAAPSIAITEYQYTAGQNVEVTVNLGIGDDAAEGIASVTFTNDSGAVTTLPTTRWSFSDGKLVFNDSYTSGLNGKTRTHVITFDDEAGTTANVTLKPAN